MVFFRFYKAIVLDFKYFHIFPFVFHMYKKIYIFNNSSYQEEELLLREKPISFLSLTETV